MLTPLAGAVSAQPPRSRPNKVVMGRAMTIAVTRRTTALAAEGGKAALHPPHRLARLRRSASRIGCACAPFAGSMPAQPPQAGEETASCVLRYCLLPAAGGGEDVRGGGFDLAAHLRVGGGGQ